MYTYVVTAYVILLTNSSLLQINLICFSCRGHFSKSTLKMAATVMTVEFGTIHHYSSLEENYEKLTEHYVNYDILV